MKCSPRRTVRCPCCGQEGADAAAVHRYEGQQALKVLLARHGSLNAAARAIADRTGKSFTATARQVARIQRGNPPSEETLDVLRTMTGRLAPYQMGRAG
ncbi:MAG: hypothetical protein LC722_04845 [Actinobacteria bacterium]|nr:hypothetical protein [Actinomycetota bacterium]